MSQQATSEQQPAPLARSSWSRNQGEAGAGAALGMQGHGGLPGGPPAVPAVADGTGSAKPTDASAASTVFSHWADGCGGPSDARGGASPAALQQSGPRGRICLPTDSNPLPPSTSSGSGGRAAETLRSPREHGPGEQAPAGIRQRVEQVTGSDLSDVRVHRGASATQDAAAVSAKAFTVGRDIIFGAGQYQPGTSQGDRLLTEELAHAAQQPRSEPSNLAGLPVTKPGDAAEQDAEQIVQRASAPVVGESVPASPMPVSIARQPGLDQRRKIQGIRVLLPSEQVLLELDDGACITVAAIISGSPSARVPTQRLVPEQRQLAQPHQGYLAVDGVVATWTQPHTATFEGVTSYRVQLVDHTIAMPQHQIQAEPAPKIAVPGTKIKFHVAMGPEISATGSRYEYHWFIYNDPQAVAKRGIRAVIDCGRDATMDAHCDVPGGHRVICYLRFHPANQPARAAELLEYQQVVQEEDQLRSDTFAQTRPADYVSWRSMLALQEFNLAEGGIQDQSLGSAAHIACYGPNPAVPGQVPHLASNQYEAHSPRKAASYRWYVRCADWEWMPTRDFFGYQRVTIDGEAAYAIPSTGKTAQWIIAESNIYTLFCQELDSHGKPLAPPLRYRQVVQSEKQAEQVRAYRKFLNQTDAAMGKMKPDKEVGLRAAYVNRETGAAISLALFLGEDKQTPGTYRLVDMMPGVDRIEYQGASPAAAIDDFARGNAYPQGSVELQIPANQQGIPPLTRIIQTKGESDWSAWAGKLGWGSLGLMLAGGIAALIPGGQVVAGCLFVAAAGGGLASSGLSLYDRLQKAELSGLGVALDVLGMASSILGGAAAFRALRGGTSVLLASRGGRFLLYSGVATSVGSGVLITLDGVAQIVDILDGSLPRAKKIEAIVRILANLALNGGLMALSLRDLGQARQRLGGLIGKEVAPGLSNEVLYTLNLLDDHVLKSLAGCSAEQLEQWARLIRADVTVAQRLGGLKGFTAASSHIEVLGSQVRIDGQLTIAPEKLAQLSDEQLGNLFKLTHALKQTGGDLKALPPQQQQLMEQLFKDFSGSSGERMRFGHQLSQAEDFLTHLIGSDARGKALLAKLSDSDRARVFDLVNAKRPKGASHLDSQAASYALAKNPASVSEFVNYFEMYVAHIKNLANERVAEYQNLVEKTLAARSAGITDPKQRAKLEREIQREISMQQFGEAIEGYGKKLDEAIYKDIEHKMGAGADLSRVGQGGQAQVDAVYNHAVGQLHGHVGAAHVSPELADGALVQAVQHLPAVQFGSESAAVYHFEKHGRELPPGEQPTAASKVQSYLNSAQRTIKQPTTSEVKLNQDGSRSIHFVRTVPENGHVYTMRAIVYVSTTGEVRLATYGKPY